MYYSHNLKKIMQTKILVLLSTYNGEQYLQEQIDSVLNQEGVDVFLLIRDDCSSDRTVEIIKDNQHRFPLKIKLVEGENIGCTKSFIELMRLALDLKEYTPEYYAFCDQDDVWLPNKLLRSVTALRSMNSSLPQLFFGNSMQTDSSLHPIQLSSSRVYKFTLGESVVSNASGGHTQVFNRILLEKASKIPFCPYILHDWWIYGVCMALSGEIYHESSPLLLYRQHAANVIGLRKASLYGKVKGLLRPALPNLSYQLAKALFVGYKSELSEENAYILRLVVEYKESFWNKIKLLMAYRFFSTYNRKTNIRFIVSVLLGTF